MGKCVQIPELIVAAIPNLKTNGTQVHSYRIPLFRGGRSRFEPLLIGLHDGLRSIFSDYAPAAVLHLDEPSLIENHFRKCSDLLGFEITPPEEYVNNIASALLSVHQMDMATACFKLNVTHYPTAADPYLRLAEAYMAKCEKELALQIRKPRN